MLKYITIISIFLIPLWNKTIKSFDLKLLSALVIMPIIILLYSKKVKHSLIKQSFIPIFISFLLFAYTLISNLQSNYTYFSSRSLVYFWTTTLFFLCGILIFIKSEDYYKLFNSLSITISISSIYAICEYFGFIKNLEGFTFPIEVTGHIGHKNVFAFIIMITIFWNIYALQQKLFFKVSIVSLLICFIALFLSDSRGALGLTIIGSIILSLPFIIKRKFYKITLYRYWFYIFSFIILVVPLLSWNENIFIRIAKIFIKSSSLSHRSEIYKAQWEMFLHKPFFGFGLGSFGSEHVFFWSKWFKQHSNGTFFTTNGHCEYLEVLCELGVIGFTLYFFFWFGAIFNAIKKLKNNTINFDYFIFISMLMMMIHASFSVASRRPPASFLLWTFVGYFWKEPFLYYWNNLSNNKKNYLSTGFCLTSLAMLFIFCQLLLGDYFYKASKIGSAMNKKSILNLHRSLQVYNNHPFALYRTARFSIGAGDFSYALSATNTLNKVAPNIFPTNYLKGYSFFYLGQMDSALFYADQELKYHSKHFDSKELKAQIFSKTGNCQELKNIQKHFTLWIVPKKLSKERQLDIKNKNYQEGVGILRSKIGGKFLLKSFKNYNKYHEQIGNKKNKKIKQILKLTCSN